MGRPDEWKNKSKSLEEGSTRSTKTVDEWAGLPPPRVKVFEDEEKQQIHNLQRFVQDRLQAAKDIVGEARSRVDVAVRDLHRAEGAQQSSTIASKLELKIESMQDEGVRCRLLSLMSEIQSNPLNNIAHLEQTVVEAKTLLHEAELQYEREMGYLNFFGNMGKTCEMGVPAVFMPLPPSIVEDTKKKSTIGGVCTSCGCAFDDTALDAFLLPCCHVYHMLCFAHACREYGSCVARGCNQSAPDRVKRMMGQKQAFINVKLEKSLSEERENLNGHVGKDKVVGSTTMDNLLTPDDFLTPSMHRASEAESAPLTHRANEAKSTMGNDAVEDLLEDALKPERIVTPKRPKRTSKQQRFNPKPLGSNELDVPLMNFVKKRNLPTK